MTDVQLIVADALRTTAERADRAYDVPRTAADLRRRMDVEDTRARRHRSVLAVAAALVVGTTALGAVLWRASAVPEPRPAGSLRPTTSASPTPPLPQVSGLQRPNSLRYPSSLQHYFISYPRGWFVFPAARQWVYPSTAQSWDTRDHYISPSARDPLDGPLAGTVTVGSQVIPRGVSAAQWLTRYRASLAGPAACVPDEPLLIDGHHGWVTRPSCASTTAVVFAGQRAFVFVGYPYVSRMGVVLDRRQLLRILATVMLG
jgi:hypothetical protein